MTNNLHLADKISVSVSEIETPYISRSEQRRMDSAVVKLKKLTLKNIHELTTSTTHAKPKQLDIATASADQTKAMTMDKVLLIPNTAIQDIQMLT